MTKAMNALIANIKAETEEISSVSVRMATDALTMASQKPKV